VAALGLTTLGAARVAAAQPPSIDGTSRFTVIVRGVRIGTESVDVTRTATTFKISSVGQLAPPFDLITSKFEMVYSADGHPQHLTIEGQLRGLPVTLSTSFGVTTATSDMLQGTRRGSVTHQISPRAVVLPNNFFGAYEGLASRLDPSMVGTRVPVYIPPDSEVSVSVDGVTSRRIVSPGGAVDLKQYDLSVTTPGGVSRVQVWTDPRGRLARVVLPASSVAVVRDDLSSVMAREETVRNPGDEDVFIAAAGFTLGATLTRASGAPARAPAVVLVGGPGRQDRDETTYGVPKFGQIAGALAAAGYVVVRYDKRGIGQSGGRPEHAGVAEYAEDVRAVVAWLRKRRDVDPGGIVLIGHAEGGPVALTAAGRDSRLSGIVLLAAPGMSGRDLTLEQQRLVLARQNESEAATQAKIAMQQRIINAVITGKGWETVPEDVRWQADTPWFRSWLLFEPAAAINRLKQPILIVHGTLDRETPAAHADRLEALAQARRGVSPARTRKVLIDGVNHLLVTAGTGEMDEYDSLPSRTVASAVTSAIIGWLNGHATLPR